MLLVELAMNNSSMDPPSQKQQSPQSKEIQSQSPPSKSSPPLPKGSSLEEPVGVVNDKTKPAVSSAPTGAESKRSNENVPISESSAAVDNAQAIDFEATKAQTKVKEEERPASARQISSSSSVSAQQQRDDTNDTIPSIVAAAATSEVAAIVVKEEVASVTAADVSKPQTEPQPASLPQQAKETAVDTRDVKMKDDDDDDVLPGDVPWTIEQHRQFVSAIFEVGLKTCSPSIIMENMRKKPKYVTRERTKSHLQKYRITKDRNKEDFLQEYDALLKETESIKQKEELLTSKSSEPPIPRVVLSKALNGKQPTELVGGQAAAFLSFSVLNNCNTDHGLDKIPYQGAKTRFPKMTEAEKQSPLGESLLYVKGLLHNMTDTLLKERHGISRSAAFPKAALKESDSSSSSEDEDNADVDKDDEKKKAAVSKAPLKRKPSPEKAKPSQHPQPPKTAMSHTGPYGYTGAFPGGQPGAYPPSFPTFPPYGYAGPVPARPMQPYPQHAPHYPPPGTHMHPYHGPPQMPPFEADHSMQHHQGVPHHYPQGHGDYYSTGHEHYNPPPTSSFYPYRDDSNNSKAYPDPEQQRSVGTKSKRSKSDKESSRNRSRQKGKQDFSRSSATESTREYPPQITRHGSISYPPFSPHGFAGPVPARPMQPYPQHSPHYSQVAYPPPGTHMNPYHGPPQLPSFEADHSMQHQQGVPHHYPHGHGDYYSGGHEHYNPPPTSSPYPYRDEPNNSKAYPDPEQQPPVGPKSKSSKSDRGSSRDRSHQQSKRDFSRSSETESSREKSSQPMQKEKYQRSKDKHALDQNLFASSRLQEKKRKRRHRSAANESSLYISTEFDDEDRGMPGLSKVESPFHTEIGSSSPITSKEKRRRVRRSHHHHQDLDQETPPAEGNQEPFFMESPFNAVYRAIQREDQQMASSKPLPERKATPKSHTTRPEKDLTPDWMFEEARLSPGEMSIASKMSRDVHDLVWAPLAIDIREHLMDRSRPPSASIDARGSPSGAASNSNRDSNHGESGSTDTPT